MLMDQDQQFVPVANSEAILREAKNFISHKRIGAHWT